MNPDALRMSPRVFAFVRDFTLARPFSTGKDDHRGLLDL